MKDDQLMKVLIFAGSLRKESLNKKVCANIVRMFSSQVDFVEVDLQQLALPVFDQDIEAKGFPAGVMELYQKMVAVDAVIISTPEYNGSISSPLKNTIDWLSRVKPPVWDRKKVLLVGASPGKMGAVQGLWHSRQPLERLGCFVYPKMYGVSQAGQAFDNSGKFSIHEHEEQVQKLVSEFLGWKL